MHKSYEIKKLIVSTHKADDDDLLLDLKIIDSFDREAIIISRIITIGSEIDITFGSNIGFKLFEKDKYN